MLAPIVIIGIILTCAIVALFRPEVGIIAFYGLYLLQPEWNWRWTVLRTFDHQETLAIATLIGTLVTFGSGNTFNRAALWAYGVLTIFIGLVFLSYLQTINATSSWFYVDVLWKAILMSGLAAYHLDSPKKVLAMMWVAVVAQGYNAFQINLQYFEDGYSLYARIRTWGFGAGDNNGYTIGTIPVIAMSGALAVFSSRWWQKALAGSIAILQIHQIMLFDSRGGMVGAMLMCVAFYVLIPKTPKTILVGLSLFLAGATLAGPSVVERFSSSFVGTENLDSSAASRFDLWKAGAQITSDYPLLGVGPRCGRYLVAGYFPQGKSGKSVRVKALHNLFFEISTGCGLPAALLYMAHFAIIWFASLVVYFRTKHGPPEEGPLRCVMLAVLAGQIGYWAASMFSSAALIESTYLITAIGAAALCIHTRLHPVTKPRQIASQEVVGSAPPQSVTA